MKAWNALHGQQNDTRQNPFRSSEDDEIRDVVSPIAPVKTAERVRSFPMVHYPSWSEVSDFDFAGNGGAGRPERRTVDGWHPWRERKDGRHELA